MSDDIEPFSLEDDGLDEGGSTPAVEDSNKSFKQLRDAYKKLEKDRAKEAKELERLRGFEAEVLGERKEKAITSVFNEVGLNPKHAELFKRVNPDVQVDSINADAVKAFAAEFELPTSAGEVPEAPAPEAVGFTPVTTGTGSPGGMLTADDIEEKLKSGDLDAVARAIAAGRVNKQAPWKQFQG